MPTTNAIELACSQLERVQNQFASVDAKVSWALGVNVAMLGLLAANAPSVKSLNFWDLLALPPIFFLSASLVRLYQCSFPRLAAGQSSLIYFREVAERTEAQYIAEYRAESDDQHLTDLLGQIWQNSKLLRRKYEYLRSSLIFLAWGAASWVVALALFAAQNNAAQSLLVVK